jgi:hypothetical protein
MSSLILQFKGRFPNHHNSHFVDYFHHHNYFYIYYCEFDLILLNEIYRYVYMTSSAVKYFLKVKDFDLKVQSAFLYCNLHELIIVSNSIVFNAR